MDLKIIVALIGVGSVLTSAFVQYYLGIRSEKRKNDLFLRSEAYLDFLNAVSDIAQSKKRSPEQLTKLTQAKVRISLIGSKLVVEATHSFFKHYGSLDTEDACISFSNIVKAMRDDLAHKSDMNFDVLNELLFPSR